jgi:hypothetical protein
MDMTDIERPSKYDWPLIVVMVGLLSFAAVALSIAMFGVLNR